MGWIGRLGLGYKATYLDGCSLSEGLRGWKKRGTPTALFGDVLMTVEVE